MVRRTTIPQRSNGELTLTTNFNGSDNAHIESTDETMHASFNGIRINDVSDWKGVSLLKNGELVMSLHLDSHIARRLHVELVRDGVISAQTNVN